MEGTITKGTTINGQSVNAGERVDISAEDFHKLKMTGDIEPFITPPKDIEPLIDDPKSAKKKK